MKSRVVGTKCRNNRTTFHRWKSRYQPTSCAANESHFPPALWYVLINVFRKFWPGSTTCLVWLALQFSLPAPGNFQGNCYQNISSRVVVLPCMIRAFSSSLNRWTKTLPYMAEIMRALLSYKNSLCHSPLSKNKQSFCNVKRPDDFDERAFIDESLEWKISPCHAWTFRLNC